MDESDAKRSKIDENIIVATTENLPPPPAEKIKTNDYCNLNSEDIEMDAPIEPFTLNSNDSIPELIPISEMRSDTVPNDSNKLKNENTEINNDNMNTDLNPLNSVLMDACTDEIEKNNETSNLIEDSGFVEAISIAKKDELDGAIEKEKGNSDGGGTSQAHLNNSTENTLKKSQPKKRNYRRRFLSSSSSSSSSSASSSSSSSSSSLFGTEMLNEIQLSSNPHEINNASSESNNNSDIVVDIDDSDVSSTYSDDPPFLISDRSDQDKSDDNDLDPSSIQEILTKEKPKYTANLVYEIMCRENGLNSYGYGQLRRKPDPLIFQNRINSSRNTIEKLKLLHSMNKHRGCVNSLNFNRAGNMLCTGSDDLKIVLWNWSLNKVHFSFQSGHQSNIFQTKFAELPSGGLNIISSGRDGQVRHSIIPPSGTGKVISRDLCKHLGSVHKLAICPTNQYEILTAGEDGYVVRCDLRDKPIERVVSVKNSDMTRKVPLYSIAHHPLDQEFVVCGQDPYVRVYDKRKPIAPVYEMCPEHLQNKKGRNRSHITCAVYSNYGNEILASYSDESIYLFNSLCYLPGHFLNKYQGHKNTNTIKGVNFFGPNSEYIVSGSDCGNIFLWDKNTETIINWMKGDHKGAVNCLEPHPSFPILATSGLDYDVKIWAPIANDYPPEMSGLEKCIKHNLKKSAIGDQLEIFDDRTFYLFLRQCMRNPRGTRRRSNDSESGPNVQDLATSSDSDDPDQNQPGFRRSPCTTQ